MQGVSHDHQRTRRQHSWRRCYRRTYLYLRYAMLYGRQYPGRWRVLQGLICEGTHMLCGWQCCTNGEWHAGSGSYEAFGANDHRRAHIYCVRSVVTDNMLVGGECCKGLHTKCYICVCLVCVWCVFGVCLVCAWCVFECRCGLHFLAFCGRCVCVFSVCLVCV